MGQKWKVCDSVDEIAFRSHDTAVWEVFTKK